MKRAMVLCSAMAVACAAPPSTGFRERAVDSALTVAVARGAGAQTSLDSVGPTGWEFFYVFGPRTSIDAMRRCVGESHGFETFGVERRDDIDVLIFMNPKGQLFSMQQPRSSVT